VVDYFLPDWRERECDLFFKLPYRTAEMARSILLCLLLEHQSVADPVMPLRLLLYYYCVN